MLILASASPRRQEILRSAGISFEVQPADVDEAVLPNERPRDCAERLAREKASRVWRSRREDTVLGADTIVTVGEAILGKPVDAKDAMRMLRMLSGGKHQVTTGVCLVKLLGTHVAGVDGHRRRNDDLGSENAWVRTASETTLVTMTELSEDDIRDYVATGEPMDKAGAYAIQGIASRWIPRIEGDYNNVVGLPMALVYKMLREKREG